MGELGLDDSILLNIKINSRVTEILGFCGIKCVNSGLLDCEAVYFC